jgi:hypothetical protein
VDSFLLGKHTGIFGMSGTPGTTPFSGSLNMVAGADMRLNRQLAPVLDRRAVIDPLARQNLILNTQVLQADQRGDTGGIITGTIGTKLGFDWYMDQNIGSYTPGTGFASGNIASTASGSVGDTTLNIINATASGQIKVGDIFSFVADTASNQYVITVTTTVSATVQSVITFYPGLKTTVVTGATLLVVSVAYTPNVAFHRDAFAWASRPLSNITTAGNIVQAPTDPVSWLALRCFAHSRADSSRSAHQTRRRPRPSPRPQLHRTSSCSTKVGAPRIARPITARLRVLRSCRTTSLWRLNRPTTPISFARMQSRASSVS